MNKPSIVLVDDEPDILLLVKYHLRKTGRWIETFSSALEALGYVRNNPTELVISDWMMPGMDGIEFCKTIKSYEHTQHIPVMMLTCKGQIEDQREAQEAGVVDFIVKPTRMDELLRRVTLVLGDTQSSPLATNRPN